MSHDSSVLNTLRAVAISLVLADHILETLSPSAPYDWYVGRLGVLFFFVHTSCVLMMSMQRTPLRGKALWLHFLLRRAFRIYPLNTVAIVMVLLLNAPVAAWTTDIPDRSLPNVLANLLIVQDLVGASFLSSPLWSLPVELQMYALLPALFGLVGPRGSVARGLMLWVGSVCIAIGCSFLGLRLLMFAPCFMSGILGYCVSQRAQPRLPFWSWPVALVCLTGVYVAITGTGTAVHSWPAAWITCLLTGFLLPQFRDTTSRFKVAADLLAKYSFGVYLFHVMALWLAFRVSAHQPWPVQWALFLGATAGASVLAFHGIEAPMIHVGGRVARGVVALVARP